MKILNVFGIKPTNNHLSAASDYYVPKITEETFPKAMQAWEKSYKMSYDELKCIKFLIEANLMSELPQYEMQDVPVSVVGNVMQLFLALDDPYITMLKSEGSLSEAVSKFINDYLVVDDSDDPKIGVRLMNGHSLLVNSGLRIGLPSCHVPQVLKEAGYGISGLYVNRSGRGNDGFDVRACLVDEDYAGFVHLSVAYTKDAIDCMDRNIVYCGDKLTQMMLIPVLHTEYEECTEEEYNEIMAGTKRGTDGFGSSGK